MADQNVGLFAVIVVNDAPRGNVPLQAAPVHIALRAVIDLDVIAIEADRNAHILNIAIAAQSADSIDDSGNMSGIVRVVNGYPAVRLD